MQSNMQHEPMSANDANGYAGSNSASSEKSPLGNIPFLKNLNSEKKQTKDGQTPKRRGPKPDSKPALTRRQELNRQAQRTHRERKEIYIKALEQEVLRLKEVYGESTRERDKIHQENLRLKAILNQHGISYDFGESPVKFQRENSGYGASSSDSISGSYQVGSDSTGFSPPSNGSHMQMQLSQMQQQSGLQSSQMSNSMAQLPTNRLDYDQIGIDFVLTLERPCMDHMSYVVVRAHNPEEQTFRHPAEASDDREYEHISGHALMATCPSLEHIIETPNEEYPMKMPDLPMPDLTKLLDLSSRLPLNHEGEITPIMAWTMLFRSPRVTELTSQDFSRIKTDLCGKVRCYGFGAVLEEFEVQDALEGVFAEKSMPTLEYPHTRQQITAEA